MRGEPEEHKKYDHLYVNITRAVEVAQQSRFKEIYLIWWSQNIGWYQNIGVPESFKPPNYTSGRIGIYIFSQG